jgi:hypothetical protein
VPLFATVMQVGQSEDLNYEPGDFLLEEGSLETS